MNLMLIDIAYGLAVALTGVVLTWLYSCRTARNAIRKAQADSTEAQKALLSLHQLTMRMAADVNQHNDTVQNITEDLQTSAKPDAKVILKQVARIIDANHKMHEQLSESEKRLQDQAQLIESQATEARTDALTHLVNRRGLDEELQRRSAESKRHGNPFSVMIVDLDHFKRLNDKWGHQAGDEVLRGVAGVLRQTMRQVDLVARYGGEEFAVVLPQTHVEQALIAAERARQAIEQKAFRFEGKDLAVTASIGVAELRPSEHHSLLVRRADKALYAAKTAGRNNAHWHDGRRALPAIENHSDHDVRTAPKPQPVQAMQPVQQRSAPADGGNARRSQAQRRTIGVRPQAITRPASLIKEANWLPSSEFPDMINGVAGRTEFCRAVQCRLGEWKRGGAGVSVILLGVFRRGTSPAGDWQFDGGSLPHATATAMTASVREMDLVAEFKPGCFGVLLPGANQTQAVAVAQRLRKVIGESFSTEGHNPPDVTTAAGLADATEGDDMVRLLKRAEEALQGALQAENNGCCWHNGHWLEPAVCSANTVHA